MKYICYVCYEDDCGIGFTTESPGYGEMCPRCGSDDIMPTGEIVKYPNVVPESEADDWEEN